MPPLRQYNQPRYGAGSTAARGEVSVEKRTRQQKDIWEVPSSSSSVRPPPAIPKRKRRAQSPKAPPRAEKTRKPLSKRTEIPATYYSEYEEEDVADDEDPDEAPPPPSSPPRRSSPPLSCLRSDGVELSDPLDEGSETEVDTDQEYFASFGSARKSLHRTSDGSYRARDLKPFSSSQKVGCRSQPT